MRWVRAARVNALVTGLGRRRPPRPAAAARPARGGLVAGPPAGRRPRPARSRTRRRPGDGGSCGPWPPGCWSPPPAPWSRPLLGWWWVLAAGIVLTVLGVPLGLGRYAVARPRRRARGPSPCAAAGWCASRRCCSAGPSSAGRCGSRSSSGGPGWPPSSPASAPGPAATPPSTWPPTRSPVSSPNPYSNVARDGTFYDTKQ